MSDAWHSVKIKQVQLVGVGSDGALLRVAGSAPRRKGVADQRPELVVSGTDGSELRFAALAAPPDQRGVLRAAYSVPAAAVGDGAVFALRLEDGNEVRLPEPERGASLPGPAKPLPPDVAVAAAGAASPAADGESDALAEHLARIDAAERRAAEADARLLEAERRTAAAETRAFAAEQHASEAETRAIAAEQRAAEIEARIEQRVAEGRAHARAEVDAAAAAAATPLRRRLAELEDSDRRREAEARSMSLEIESLRGSRAQRERELRDALDSVRKMTFERDELSRQAEAFDGVATKARERAGEAEAAYAQASARLQELEIWRGELERRLAATTTELGAARTRIREDERELALIRDELLRARAGAPPAPPQFDNGPAVGGAPVDLEQLAHRAEAEAAAQAERELAQYAERPDRQP